MFSIFVPLASQVAHHAAFHQPENTSSAAFHFSGYHATECSDTGFIAEGYHAPANHARLDTDTYHDTATENTLGKMLGGVGYDHGDFPRIVSVHSMAESCQESNTNEATADCLSNPQVKAENALKDVTDAEKSTNHSIATILDLSSSSPVQNFNSIKPISEVCSLGNNARGNIDSDENELVTESEYISTEDENAKVRCGCPCSNLYPGRSLRLFLPRQGQERRESLGSKLASLFLVSCMMSPPLMLVMISEHKQRFSSEVVFIVS